MTEEIEIILRELMYDDLTYSYDTYKENLINDIKELNSFALSFLLDKCLYFGVSPIFIYLLIPKLKEKEMSLIFELTLLLKSNLITNEKFIEYFDLICSGKKSLSEICKMVLGELKVVFTPKSFKKNALFAYNDFLYRFSVLPILDSGSMLTKEPHSLKFMPSTLFPTDYKISLETTKMCLNGLKDCNSKRFIFSTLNKLFNLYYCDDKLKNEVESLDFNSLTIKDFHSILGDMVNSLDKDLCLLG